MTETALLVDLNNNSSYRPSTLLDGFLLSEELAQENLYNCSTRLEIGHLIGSGGFGSVYKGTFCSRDVAVKILDRQSTNPAAREESYQAELRVLSLKHPNVVKTLAVTDHSRCDNTGAAMVIMEFVPGRNLQDLISSPDEDLPPLRRVKYALQLTTALEYAHRHCIVHLDFKPANVLITPDDNCKLADFGCCQRISADTGSVSPTQRSILTGTIAYRAPEVLKGEAPTIKADIYSVGITLWQMLSRKAPHGNEKHPHVIVFGVVAQNLRPELVRVEGDPFELYYTEVYVACWAPCPNDRPATAELIQVFELWQRHL